VSLSASAQTSQTPELFSDAADVVAPSTTPGRQPTTARAVMRSRAVRVRPDLLAAGDRQPHLLLSLFPDARFRAEPGAVETQGFERYIWRARLAGIEDGEATIAVTGGVMAGSFTMPGAQYRLRYAGAGLHVIEQLDTAQLPPELEPIVPSPAMMGAAAPLADARDDAGLIDVLVVYTPRARAAAGGAASMASLIALAVGNANSAYANSGAGQRIRLVHSAEIAYDETPDMATDLGRLRGTADGFMDGVHGLRDQYRADLVGLLTDGDDACGIGYLMTSVSPGFAPNAFTVTAWNCAAGNLSFAHELGHNMGLHHDVANAGGPVVRPYAYGYQDPGFFRTVMAYACASASCPRVQHFSTPARTYGGRPTGVAQASENARVLDETAPAVANFRQAAAACSYTIAPAAAVAPARRGGGSIAITASDAACPWSAVSQSPFLSVTSAVSGSGSGTVTYAVAPNPAAAPRAGTLAVAGRVFTVTQAAATAPRARADFTGDGRSDVAVFRPGAGRWYVAGGPTIQWGAPGDIPVPADYTGDGITDAAVYRRSTGAWHVHGGGTVVYGLPGDVPVPADYNADGITDIAIFRPASGAWHIRDGGSLTWGLAGDLPVPGDFNGDGWADVAVWRPATGIWYVRGGAATQWGQAGDIPVPADYDGNGTTDLAVWRPSSGTWFVKDQFTRTIASMAGSAAAVPVPLDRNGDGRAELGLFQPETGAWFFLDPLTSAVETMAWGAAGDLPVGTGLPALQAVSGDFDGDRRADLTVFRGSSGQWFTLRSITGLAGSTVAKWGQSGDVPVAGDYDGDGQTDHAVYRPSAATWFLTRSSLPGGGPIAVAFGSAGDLPVPGDYDGDRRTDLALFRPSAGRWLIRLSSTGATVEYDFGLGTDVPVAADYDGDRQTDIAVYRPSSGRWYVLDRAAGTYSFIDWGLSGDRPVPGDYDGDGRADRAVFRPSLGRWVILRSSTGHTAYDQHDFGLEHDIAVPADYDGDGRTDIAIFRPSAGRWYVLDRFQGTYFFRDWGLSDDVPIVGR
jgi:hypothetical protein